MPHSSERPPVPTPDQTPKTENPFVRKEDFEREHLTPEALEQVHEAYRQALQCRLELKDLFAANPEPTRELLKEILEKYRDSVMALSGKSWLDSEGKPQPIYNLDIDAEERYHILMARSVSIWLEKNVIKEWLEMPDHRRGDRSGLQEYNNFYNYFRKGINNKRYPRESLGQVFEALNRRYPEIVESLSSWDTDDIKDDMDKIKASDKFEESEQYRDLIEKSKQTKDYELYITASGLANAERRRLTAEYIEQHPASLLAKRMSTLNFAYNVLVNDYGLTWDQLCR